MAHNLMYLTLNSLFFFSLIAYLFHKELRIPSPLFKDLTIILIFILGGALFHSLTLIDHDWRYKFPYIAPISIFTFSLSLSLSKIFKTLLILSSIVEFEISLSLSDDGSFPFFSLRKIFHELSFHSFLSKLIIKKIDKNFEEFNFDTILMPYEAQPFQHVLFHYYKQKKQNIKTMCII